jgi:hypothetical protein
LEPREQNKYFLDLAKSVGDTRVGNKYPKPETLNHKPLNLEP